jgi:hypothetical protein
MSKPELDNLVAIGKLKTEPGTRPSSTASWIPQGSGSPTRATKVWRRKAGSIWRIAPLTGLRSRRCARTATGPKTATWCFRRSPTPLGSPQPFGACSRKPTTTGIWLSMKGARKSTNSSSPTYPVHHDIRGCCRQVGATAREVTTATPHRSIPTPLTNSSQFAEFTTEIDAARSCAGPFSCRAANSSIRATSASRPSASAIQSLRSIASIRVAPGPTPSRRGVASCGVATAPSLRLL